jgi:hypothetical protein
MKRSSGAREGLGAMANRMQSQKVFWFRWRTLWLSPGVGGVIHPGLDPPKNYFAQEIGIDSAIPDAGVPLTRFCSGSQLSGSRIYQTSNHALLLSLQVAEQSSEHLFELVVLLPLREVADMSCASNISCPRLCGLHNGVVKTNRK